MRYVSLDLETTGLEPKQPDRILQIAMVIEDNDHPEVPVEDLPRFSAIILPDIEVRGSPTALAMNSWILIAIEMFKTKMNHKEFMKRYRDLGVPDATLERAFIAKLDNIFGSLEEVLEEADAWLDNYFGPKSKYKVNVAGKNVAGFDMMFLPVEFASRFRHRVIDPGSVFIDWSKDRVDDSGEIARRTTGSLSVSHDALGDARDVITWLRHSYPKIDTPKR